MSETIVSRIAQHAADAPDRVCAIFSIGGARTALTYGELTATARALAHGMKQRGVGEGDLVALVHESHAHLFAAFLGAMMIGAVPTMMPPPSPKQHPDLFWRSHEELYRLLAPKLFVASAAVEIAYRRYLPAHANALCTPDDLLRAGPFADPPLLEADAVAFIQHSSGTTALKKGVALTHRAVLEQLDLYADCVGLSAASVIASWLPLYHDMGLIACFLLPLCRGVSVVTLHPLEWSMRPTSLLTEIARSEATHAWMPNFAFEHLCNAARQPESFDLSSLRAVINCSEPCRVETYRRFTAHFAPAGLAPTAMQVCYAMAENVFAVSQTRLAAAAPTVTARLDGAATDVELLSCGPPLKGVQIRILSPEGETLADGRPGEIALLTTTLFSGYYKRADLTARAFDGAWYRTGDVGMIRDGELYVLGRADDVIVSYGRNFVAYELEAVLAVLPEVAPGRAVVFSVQGGASGTQELVALCEPAEPYAGDHAQVQRAVRLALEAAAGLAPRHVGVVPRGTLIKSTSGKISRRANREAYVREFSTAAVEKEASA